MYKILNKLFGWDYIICYYWTNNWKEADIARIIKVDNKVIIFCFKYETNWLITKKDINKIVWLTCSPDKYIKL